jgi:hypothetical protein
MCVWSDVTARRPGVSCRSGVGERLCWPPPPRKEKGAKRRKRECLGIEPLKDSLDHTEARSAPARRQQDPLLPGLRLTTDGSTGLPTAGQTGNEVAEQVGGEVLWSTAHVFLLEARDAGANGRFDFAQGLHGRLDPLPSRGHLPRRPAWSCQDRRLARRIPLAFPLPTPTMRIGKVEDYSRGNSPQVVGPLTSKPARRDVGAVRPRGALLNRTAGKTAGDAAVYFTAGVVYYCVDDTSG